MERDEHGDVHVDEATVHAWLDGALAPGEAARVAAHVEGCAACAEMVAEARGLIAASSRILSALDHVPADVVPARRRAVPWYRGWPVRVAASVVVAVVGGMVVADRLHLVAPTAREASPVMAPAVARPAPVAVATAPETSVRSPKVATPVKPQLKSAMPPQRIAGVRVVAPAETVTSRIVVGSTVVVDTEKARADAVAPAAADSAELQASELATNAATPARTPAPMVLRQMVRAAPLAGSRLSAGVGTSTLAAAKQGSDSIARAGCYDVEAAVAGALPRRIVLDTTSFGDSGLMRRVARVAPAESARTAYWVAPAPDSVEVVIFDGPTLAGRVTARGWNGAAAGLPFTARRCGAH